MKNKYIFGGLIIIVFLGIMAFLFTQTNIKYEEDFANIAVQDWLKVSSPEFKNENKFPVFMYPDNGIGEALVTTGDYTRINEKYQDMPPSMSKLDGWKPDPNAPPQRTYFWFRLSDKYLYFQKIS